MDADLTMILKGTGLFLVFVGTVIYFIAGMRVVRPTHRGLLETLGKYSKFCQPGFHWIWAGFQDIVLVEITEEMTEAESQEIITSDNLNANVAAQVYYKVRDNEESVKNSEYVVNDYEDQIVSLCRTTLRNIIGGMSLTEANTGRSKINQELQSILQKEANNWGIEIVRTELKEINPPPRVQEAMNNIVIAENEKKAAKDFAVAAETKADGLRMAALKAASGEKDSNIMRAEGEKQAIILKSQGQAEAIKIFSDAAKANFTGEAQLLRKIDATVESLKNNSKIVVMDKGQSLFNVIGDAGIK